MKNEKQNKATSPDLIIIDRTTTKGSKTKLTSKTFKRDNESIPALIINQKLSDVFAPNRDIDVFIGNTGEVHKISLTDDEIINQSK